MSGKARCDEILRLIDEVLGDGTVDGDTSGSTRSSRRSDGGDARDT